MRLPGTPSSRLNVCDHDGEGIREWQPVQATPAGPKAVRFLAPEDGSYGCYLILHNEAGASAAPPTPSVPPHRTVVVDTRPPTFQIHGTLERPSRPDATARLIHVVSPQADDAFH